MSHTPNCPNCGDCCVEVCVGHEILCARSCGCCCTIEVKITPDSNLVAGTILGQRESDGLYGAYTPAATDGLQYPRGILRRDVQTDADGNLLNYHNVWGIAGCPPMTADMYVCGDFRLEETHGNLAAALAHPGFGRVYEGFVGGSGMWKLL